MPNPFFRIPLFPTFDVPETFGKAMSYEGQIHAICHAFSQLTDGYNTVLNYVNDAFPWEFADPIEWEQSRAYPAHVMVYDEASGRTYVSVQDVPAGIALTNSDYWVPISSLNAGQNVFRVTDYPGVRADGVECTQAIQDAIDSMPYGARLIFPQGEYLFSRLVLKSGVEYDFDGSTLRFTGPQGLYCEGTERGTYVTSGEYVASSMTVPVSTSPDVVRVGDLIVISDTAERFHTARSYYYRGGVFQVADRDSTMLGLSECMPLSMAAGTQVVAYEPASVHIHDVGSLEYVGNTPDAARGIMLGKNALSVIERVRCESEMYAQIEIYHSYRCVIRDCSLRLYSTLSNSYCVILGSTNSCEVANCDMVGSWCAISPGYHEPNYNNWVHDCSLQCVGSGTTQYAYGAHENDYSPVIERCFIEGLNVAASATVRDCRIKFNAATYCNILFATYPECGRMTFEGCEFIPNPGTQNNVRFAIYPQVTADQAYHQGSIVFSHCKFSDDTVIPSATSTNVGFVATQAYGFELDELVMNDCHNLRLVTAPASSTNTRIHLIRLDNVTFQTYSRSDFNRVDELVWVNSVIRRGYATTLFRIGDGCVAHISDVTYEQSDGTDSNAKISVDAGAVAYLSNVSNDCTSANFAVQAGGEVHFTNCRLSIFQWATVKPSITVTGDSIDHNGIRRIYEHYNNVQYQGYFDGTGYTFS